MSTCLPLTKWPPNLRMINNAKLMIIKYAIIPLRMMLEIFVHAYACIYFAFWISNIDVYSIKGENYLQLTI